MSRFHQSSVQTLSEWLEIATRDLVPSAQTRIRAEIEAHCAEAVQYHLQTGSPESAARAAALADLGDAQAAAKRFGEEFLITKEVHEIKAVQARVKTDDARGPAVPHPQPTFWRRVASNSVYLLILAQFIVLECWRPLDLRHFLLLAASILALLLIEASLTIISVIQIRKRANLPPAFSLISSETLKVLKRRIKIPVSIVTIFTSMFVLLSILLPARLSNSFYFPLMLTAYWGIVQVRAYFVGQRKSQSLFHLRQKLLAAPEERQKIFPVSESDPIPPGPSTA